MIGLFFICLHVVDDFQTYVMQWMVVSKEFAVTVLIMNRDSPAITLQTKILLLCVALYTVRHN